MVSGYEQIATRRSDGYQYDWDDPGEQHFADQVQCYWALTYALHKVQDACVDTGIESVPGFTILIDVHSKALFRNARVNPETRKVIFAGSNRDLPDEVDWAADNDIAWHELGHLLIYHFHGPSIKDYTTPRAAVEEAMCDVFAVALGSGNGKFAEYAGISRASLPRDLTVRVCFSEELARDEDRYAAALIWESACWRIRQRLVEVFGEQTARTIFERLALGTMTHWSHPYDFGAAVGALLLTASELTRDQPRVQTRLSKVILPVLEEWKLPIPLASERPDAYWAKPLRPLGLMIEEERGWGRSLIGGAQVAMRLGRKLMGSLGLHQGQSAVEIAELAVIESLRSDETLVQSLSRGLGPLGPNLGPWVAASAGGPSRRIEHQQTLSAGKDIQLVYHQRLTEDGYRVVGGRVRTWVDMQIKDAIATEVSSEVVRSIPPRPDRVVPQLDAESVASAHLVEHLGCKEVRVLQAELAVYYSGDGEGIWIWSILATDVNPPEGDWLVRLQARDGRVIGAIPLFVQETWTTDLDT